MSSEREIVLQRIGNYEAELRVVKEELGKTRDSTRGDKLENRRDRLEETIGTLEKRALALTPLPAGKTIIICSSFIVLRLVCCLFLSIFILYFHTSFNLSCFILLMFFRWWVYRPDRKRYSNCVCVACNDSGNKWTHQCSDK